MSLPEKAVDATYVAWTIDLRVEVRGPIYCPFTVQGQVESGQKVVFISNGSVSFKLFWTGGKSKGRLFTAWFLIIMWCHPQHRECRECLYEWPHPMVSFQTRSSGFKWGISGFSSYVSYNIWCFAQVTHSLQLSSEESWCTVPYMVPMTSKLEADIEHHEANLMFLLI